jgi:methionine synthase I (cobalamin-dependent)
MADSMPTFAEVFRQRRFVRPADLVTSMLTPGEWNIVRREEDLCEANIDRVREWTERNCSAGAMLLPTPTLSTSAACLERWRLAASPDDFERWHARNLQLASAVVRIARQNGVWAAGALKPLVECTDSDGRDPAGYVRLIQALIEAGVDVLLLENVGDPAAFDVIDEALRRLGFRGRLPMIVSMPTYSGGVVRSGEAVVETARSLVQRGVFAIGIEHRYVPQNPDELLGLMEQLSDVPLCMLVDVREHQENDWSRNEENTARVRDFYRRCLERPNCRMIGGGRGSTLADVAADRALVAAADGV